MPDDEKKDDFLTAPLENSERTTTHRAPPASGETPPDLPAGSLHSLRQRYDILAELGRGGMGIVYKARDHETGAVVALKVLRPEIAADTAVIARFKSELLLARKFTHKNVCRIYELLRFDDTVAIAMEFVEGESLRAFLNRFGSVPLRRGLEWAKEICGALGEAHAQGVVHRDLKPENIFIDGPGHAKVMDFGIARSVETAATQTGSTFGTPAYMSPEQAEGKAADARSDIYALGLIFYEMFAGRAPFQADTPVSFALKQIHETPPPPRSVEPYLPPFLDRAIQKCLEKKPKDRFQNVEELADVLSGESPLEAGPVREPKPRDRLLVWGVWDSLLLVLGVAGLICFLALRDDVFPGSKTQLEIDALGAEREARTVDERLGRPQAGGFHAQLETEDLADSWRSAFVSPQPPFKDFSKLELPLHWGVEMTWGWGCTVRLDSKGKVEQYSHPYWGLPWDYRAPPLDQRREVARKALEQVCGPLPPNLTPVEMSGGELGATYDVFWTRRVVLTGGTHVASISLIAEKVTEVQCRAAEDMFSLPHFLYARQLGFQPLAWLTMIGFLIAFMAYFSIGQCHRSPLLWKRAPLALALGIAGTWVLAPSFVSSRPPFLAMLGVGVEASCLLLVGLVAVEDRLTRVAPGWISTYGLFLRGKFLEPAVGLAVLRGALAGTLLGGMETLGAYISLAAYPRLFSPPNLVGSFYRSFLCFWLDPTAAVSAAVSSSPAFFAAFSALFHGLILGFLFTGLVLVAASKRFLRSQQKAVGSPTLLRERFAFVALIAVALTAAVFALRLHFAQTLGPSWSTAFVPLLLGVTLGWLVLSYDILTAVVAVFTYVLWTLNYPLLGIFETTGNEPEWGLFIGWGVLVVAGSLAGFSPGLVGAWRRLRAESL